MSRHCGRRAFDVLYRACLAAYPAEFRRRFGVEMLQLAQEEQRECASIKALSAAQLRLVTDTLAQGCAERWFKVRSGGTLPRLCSSGLALAISVSLLRISQPQVAALNSPTPRTPGLGGLPGALAPLGDPTVAFLLLTAGLFGIMFEASSPGALIPGILGTLCTIAGAISLAALPLNYLGLALVLCSVGVSLAGIKMPAHGLLSSLGLVLFVGGALALFNFGSSGLSISGPVIFITAACSSVFFAMIARLGKRARELPALMAPDDLVGKLAEARTPLNTHGKVFVRGEWWNAISDERVSGGSKVQILAMDGLTLQVRPVPATQLMT